MLKLRKPQVSKVPQQLPQQHQAIATTEVEVPEESAAEALDTNVQVIYGASVQMLPLAGQALSAARPLLEMILRANPRSPIVVNGRQVPANYVITGGDIVEIVHHAGEKGAAHGLAY